MTGVSCGDGILDTSSFEECDFGYNDNTDGCSNQCEIITGYECSVDGSNVSTCAQIVCGDGVKGSTEECDDGNTDDNDGCSSTCKSEAGCPNGIVDEGEECDDNNTDSGDGCDTCMEETGWNCMDHDSDPSTPTQC